MEKGPLYTTPDHFAHIGPFPISRNRLITALANAVAVAAMCSFLLAPGSLFYFATPLAILIPIYSATCVSASHFKGGRIKVSKYMLYSGIIGSAIALPLDYVIPQERYTGALALFFIALVVAWVNSLSDPTYTRMNVVKFSVQTCLFCLVFLFERDTAVVSALRFLYIHAIAFVLGMLFAVFSPIAIKQIPRESVSMLMNCEVFFRHMVLHLRLPRLATASQTSSGHTSGIQTSESLTDAPDDTQLPPISQTTFQSTAEENADLEETLRLLSKRIASQLRHIKTLLVEAQEETWIDSELLQSFQSFFTALSRLFEELTGMHLALREGFDWQLSFEQIIPVLPLLNQLQLHLSYFCHSIADKVDHTFDDYKWLYGRTAMYIAALHRTVRKIKKRYVSTIRDGERGRLLNSSVPEVLRMNYFVWKLMNLRKVLIDLNDATDDLATTSRKHTSWHIWPSVFGTIAKPFVDILTSMRDFCRSISHCCTPDETLAEPSFGQRIQHWWRAGHWRFGLRYALAISSCTIFAYGIDAYIDSTLQYDIKAVWSPVTCGMVMVVPLGASLKRGWQRFTGTIIGGVAGGVTRMLVGIANAASGNLYGPFVMTAASLLVTFIATYFQHSSQIGKPYNWIVTLYTYLIIAFAAYPYPTLGQEFDIAEGWILAGLRAVHVTVGFLWALVFSLVFWTRSADMLAGGMARVYQTIQVALNDLVINNEKSINREHISAAVKEVTVEYPSLFQTMKEAKTELSAQRNTRKIIKNVYTVTLPLATTLHSMQTILKFGFKPHIIVIVKQLAPQLNALYKALNNGAIVVTHFFDKRAGADTTASPANLATLVKHLDKRYKAIRRTIMQSQDLHTHYPGLIRFQAYLSVLRDFAFHWQKLLDILHKETAKESYARLSPVPVSPMLGQSHSALPANDKADV